MKKIKLLLAAPTYYPFFGGAEMRFRRYLPFLQKHGIESCVFTGTPKAKKISSDHKNQQWYDVKYGERLPDEVDQGINVIRYRLPESPAKKRIGVYQAKLRDYIRDNSSSIDVIQFLSPFTLSAIKTFEYAKKKNIATVVACTIARKPDPNFIKRILYSHKVKTIYSAADCVVVSSEEVKDYLLSHGVRTNIEIIGNGIDTQKYQPVRDVAEKNSIRNKLGVPHDKKVVLNVGSIIPRKGTDLLLSAFELLVKERDDVELYIAGESVDKVNKSLDEFQRRVIEIAEKPGVKERVHFLGYVDNIDEYMKAADVFAFPSREEGMGNVVMEGMASGIPIVVTPYLGFPSVFGRDKNNYLLSDFDAVSIMKNIQKCLGSDSSIKNMINNSLNHVRINLSLSDSLHRYAALYKQLKKS